MNNQTNPKNQDFFFNCKMQPAVIAAFKGWILSVTPPKVEFKSGADNICKGANVEVQVEVTPASAASMIEFESNSPSVVTTTSTISGGKITLTGASEGSTQIMARLKNDPTQQIIATLNASVIENSNYDNNQTLIEQIAATIAFQKGLWGFVYPEDIDAEYSACRKADQWIPIISSIKGKYSFETRLLPSVEEVTGIGGNTTNDNYCKQVSDLNFLGKDPQTEWYLLAAVIAHEEVHENTLAPILKEVIAQKNVDLLELQGGVSADIQNGAILFFKQTQAVIYDILLEWRDRVSYQGTIDDIYPDGAAYQAERLIVQPMIASICGYAVSNVWQACFACP